MPVNIESVLQQFGALPLEQQLKVAEIIDRLTWAKRWSAVCERITSRREAPQPVGDDEIDSMVRAIRREKPLSARSSTLPS